MIEILTQLYYFIMERFEAIGLIVFFLAFIFDKKEKKIHLDGVAKFIAFAFIVMFAQLGFSDLKNNPPQRLHEAISYSGFLTVWLEDAFFVMIPFYLCKIIHSKYTKFFLWLVFSIMFGLGHDYQGFDAIFITALYPYFISRRYAIKTNFLTVMTCHFLWDCFVLTYVHLHRLIYFY